jgi:subtilisin family serine protease
MLIKTNRLLLCWIVSLFSFSAFADARYILELKLGTDAQPITTKYGLTIVRSWSQLDHFSIFASSPQALSALTITQIRAEKGVIEVEADSTIRSSESETDSKAKAALEVVGPWFPYIGTVNYFGSKVHLGYVWQPTTLLIAMSDAHNKYGLGTGTVAIIDTGVDTNHEALRNVLLPGYDFTRDRSDTVSEFYDLTANASAALQQSTVEILDSKKLVVQVNTTTAAILAQSTVEILDGKGLPSAFGHGTMVAGLVHLVAPAARIMPLKAFKADGSAQLSDIVRAIRYAADHGAAVISMSFSFTQYSAELKAAIDYANSRGALCVASSGNAGKEVKVYPAALSNVIGIGSTNYSDKRSPFSNYGSSAKTSAPGEAIVTTFPGNTYAAVWGTSFSTGLAAGAASLFRQVKPNLNFQSYENAFDYGLPINQDMGDSRLHLIRSLDYLLRKH